MKQGLYYLTHAGREPQLTFFLSASDKALFQPMRTCSYQVYTFFSLTEFRIINCLKRPEETEEKFFEIYEIKSVITTTL
jgi:hypothetical protein